MQQQPWIGKPLTDIIFILLPPFLCLLIIALFPSLFEDAKGIPDAGWIILILLIDVAHVYSTLYRTYFDPVALQKQKTVLLTIPLVGFILGVLLYSISPLLFWRLLAYVAVFHFIRQQYGFMRLYSRKEKQTRLSSALDTWAIYYATLYPLLYWHLEGPRNFNWFIDDDFVYLRSALLLNVFTVLYFILLSAWLIKEIILSIQTKQLNIPKTLIVTGTALSWYGGIIYFNGDLAFTLLNVVSHGIPYMALIWIYGKKNYGNTKSRFLRIVFSKYGLLIFLASLFLFAFIEEGLWDIAVWKEHGQLLGTAPISTLSFNKNLLAFIVPLLALPQITHYILDGFIWRIRKDKIII